MNFTTDLFTIGTIWPAAYVLPCFTEISWNSYWKAIKSSIIPTEILKYFNIYSAHYVFLLTLSLYFRCSLGTLVSEHALLNKLFIQLKTHHQFWKVLISIKWETTCCFPHKFKYLFVSEMSTVKLKQGWHIPIYVRCMGLSPFISSKITSRKWNLNLSRLNS